MHPGIFTAAELYPLGDSNEAIADLVAAGRLIRLRRGWFASPLASTDALRAVELGGRLGCLSGCEAHGLWVPPHSGLHVMLNPGAVAERKPEGVTFHRSLTAHHEALIPLDDCLAQVLHRHGVETGLVVVESAVNLGLLHEADARAILRAAPARHQAALGHFRLGAQSGSETRLRLFLQRRNVPVQPQVEIPGVGWVDLLVGKSLIVEADSRSHHSSARDSEYDCARDLAARHLGYTVTRLSYEQIWDTWDMTQRLLSAELRLRRHRLPPRPIW